eukprot:NODE_117_length_18986_cov_0.639540.p1 type:complete len:518 gc:universal NODE_117_length_18986_cov_0.639540:17334-15781(-)
MINFLEKYSSKKPSEIPTLFPPDKLPSDNSITLYAADKPHLLAISYACSMDEWLAELTLADVRIGSEGCRVLCSCLKNNFTLKKLNLSGNFLQSESCRYLGDMVRINTSIEHLLLELNNLGVYEDEFRLFCIGVGKNTNIRYIDMRNNQITSEGGRSLAESLSINNSLKYVDLRWNIIGLLSSKYLVNLSNRNRELLEIKLEGNDIPNEDIQLIYKNLDRNRMEFRFENNQKTHDRLILGLLKELKSKELKTGNPRESALELERNKLLNEISALKDTIEENQLRISKVELENASLTSKNVKLTGELANEMKQNDAKVKSIMKNHEQVVKELKTQIITLQKDKANLDLDLDRISFKCTTYIDELKIIKSMKSTAAIANSSDTQQHIIDSLKSENEALKNENNKLEQSKSTFLNSEQERKAMLVNLQKQVKGVKADYSSLKSKYKSSINESQFLHAENKRLSLLLNKELRSKQNLKELLEKNKSKLKTYNEYVMRSKQEKQKFLSAMGHIKLEIDDYCK